jgi:hypothetical protein
MPFEWNASSLIATAARNVTGGVTP